MDGARGQANLAMAVGVCDAVATLIARLDGGREGDGADSTHRAAQVG